MNSEQPSTTGFLTTSYSLFKLTRASTQSYVTSECGSQYLGRNTKPEFHRVQHLTALSVVRLSEPKLCFPEQWGSRQRSYFLFGSFSLWSSPVPRFLANLSSEMHTSRFWNKDYMKIRGIAMNRKHG